MLFIEFVGGPFDGHQQACVAISDKLPQDVLRLVCNDAFDPLEGVARNRAGRFTSVALYGLELRPYTRRYLFSGAISYAEFGELLRHVV